MQTKKEKKNLRRKYAEMKHRWAGHLKKLDMKHGRKKKKNLRRKYAEMKHR